VAAQDCSSGADLDWAWATRNGIEPDNIIEGTEGA
jgi:hypothetical protein